MFLLCSACLEVSSEQGELAGLVGLSPVWGRAVSLHLRGAHGLHYSVALLEQDL